MSREIKFRAWESGDGRWLDDVEGHTIESLNDLEVVLEQYTGLKDKNGVEIYEGDICEAVNGLPYVCRWCDEYAGWVWDWRGVGDPSMTYHNWDWDADATTIVGNIHENPELLTWPRKSKAEEGA